MKKKIKIFRFNNKKQSNKNSKKSKINSLNYC